jgi:hypothetical protein
VRAGSIEMQRYRERMARVRVGRNSTQEQEEEDRQRISQRNDKKKDSNPSLSLFDFLLFPSLRSLTHTLPIHKRHQAGRVVSRGRRRPRVSVHNFNQSHVYLHLVIIQAQAQLKTERRPCSQQGRCWLLACACVRAVRPLFLHFIQLLLSVHLQTRSTRHRQAPCMSSESPHPLHST